MHLRSRNVVLALAEGRSQVIEELRYLLVEAEAGASEARKNHV
ncbi:hypothetical protein [Sorangium sp. So ce693]